MEGSSAFRRDFKYYKSKCPPPNFDEVVDFSNLDKDGSSLLSVKAVKAESYHPCDELENHVASLMKPPLEWDIYEVTEKAGLLFIRNPFTPEGQRYWTCRCLRDFTRKPHLLNLDSHKDFLLSEDWWQACQRKDERSRALKMQLRWATMGYHHNWNTKVYSDASKDPFPPDLAALSSYVARIMGFKEEFKAQAAIVNFYHFDSTLSGHTDHSEIDMTAPLLSFSFGQTAIFLLGGLSPDEKPIPLFIKSGDIVIMSGHSRQCFHGIPRVLPSSDSPWDSEQKVSNESKEGDSFHSTRQNVGIVHSSNSINTCNSSLQMGEDEASQKTLCENGFNYCRLLGKSILDERFWEPFNAYINNSRINMNVRQVLPTGCTTLSDK